MSSQNDVPRQHASDEVASRSRLHCVCRWTRPMGRREDEVLPAGATLLHGLQHVPALSAGLIVLSWIIGQASGLSTASSGSLMAVSISIAGLAIAGLATVIQTIGAFCIDARLPVMHGVPLASATGSRSRISAKRSSCLVLFFRETRSWAQLSLRKTIGNHFKAGASMR